MHEHTGPYLVFDIGQHDMSFQTSPEFGVKVSKPRQTPSANANMPLRPRVFAGDNGDASRTWHGFYCCLGNSAKGAHKKRIISMRARCSSIVGGIGCIDRSSAAPYGRLAILS